VIGDTLETDILGGAQLGFEKILVSSGGTSGADRARFVYQPHKIVDSIADLDPVKLIREFTTTTPQGGAMRHSAAAERLQPERSSRSNWNDSSTTDSQVRREACLCNGGASRRFLLNVKELAPRRDLCYRSLEILRKFTCFEPRRLVQYQRIRLTGS
jgi:hypothetical protein